jgi:hypothetical protein
VLKSQALASVLPSVFYLARALADVAEELPFEKKIPDGIAKALEKRFEDSGIKKKTKEKT